MRRRLLALLAAAGLLAGGTALAQSGSDPYELPEPAVRDGQVLQLAAAAGCVRDARLRVRFTPPAGAVFGWFEVRVRGRQVVRLTGIPRAASATVRVPQSGARLAVSAETLGGQRLRSTRVYADCTRPPDTGSGGQGGSGQGGGAGEG